MSLETSVDLKYKAVEDFQIFAITMCMQPLFENRFIDVLKATNEELDP